MYNTIIAEIDSLKNLLSKGDSDSKMLIKEIDKNPSNFDLTYAVWTLVKGDIDIYLEDLDKVDYPDPETPNSESANDKAKDNEPYKEDYNDIDDTDTNMSDDIPDSNESNKEENNSVDVDTDPDSETEPKSQREEL
eukprot:TRINITY_DN6927_c0_g1_i4.p2 TRINITY_DN6927_c0_g1~~TRINITY_DN6927_c0_g1_i4.p2  ORF type:complete len:136 (+),score=27.00 TRINITY_DN6927_c0_g1_i4:172-579(+)